MRGTLLALVLALGVPATRSLVTSMRAPVPAARSTNSALCSRSRAWPRTPQPVMQVTTTPSFSPSGKEFEPRQVELQRSWFQAWGFAEPDPPKDATGAGMGMGMGMSGGKGKKGGKKGPPKAAATGKLFCKAPPDDLVLQYRAEADAAGELTPDELAAWGAASRVVVDEALPRTGAVLLRGLPMRSAEDFSHFWKGHLSTAPALVEGRYNSLGPSGGRDKMSGIDMATNVPPQFLLLCHNEMCYNPKTIERIALYCIQDAREGGESLIARNSDLNKNLPANVATFIKDHGGIKYQREFFDARNPPKATLTGGGGVKGSWQDKCSLPKDAGRDEATAFFKEMGFTDGDMVWDDEGVLTLSNHHPGFITDPETGEEVWWNIVHTGSLVTGDGTPFPKKMVQEIQKNGWAHTYAFKLKPGDWLVCDNLRVQHGRLPFSPEGPKRVLLTVYSGPTPSC